MATAVDQFLGKLQRTLSDYEKRHPNGMSTSSEFRVTAVNQPYVNEKLDNCLVLERVGSGAMSVVYKARQDFTDRLVAIKMLRAQLCCDPANVKRFQREAKAIARLNHQNLLNVYGVGRTKNGQPYIIMDFIEGKSLAQIIAEQGAIPWQRVATIFIQACDAMQHAHAHRIIHRDLKPDNIMLIDNPSGVDHVKVVDFGIVKITDESQALSQRLTQTGEVWGSPVYMSPEQCMGRDLDHRSDIYSLGTVLYECLTGKEVFSAKLITEIVMKQLNQKPESFATVRGDLDIPAWLEQITMKALEKDPADRFASMEEMKRHIERGLLSNKDTADSVLKPPMASDSHVTAVRMPLDSEDDFIGKTIGGKFFVQSLIGDGGMSVVYKAQQQGINRPVAIKLLRDELCDEEANVKRFMREARAVSQLTHPNLVAIYDVGTAFTGQPYMVMEYLQGQSLSELLEDTGKLPLERALPIFIQVCDVMQFAHSQGFIHRDLKPHNIMLITAGDRKDFVKLVDFGIVAFDGQRQAASQKLTAAGEICGSPIYMSPEQVLDEPVDARSDIYSFGIVMYECLAGRPVFGGKKITDVLSKHVNAAPPPFCESAPELDIPPALEGVIFKTLEKKPNLRFNTMGELKESLTMIGKKAGYISSVSLGPTASAARMLAAQSAANSASEMATTTASGVRPAITREQNMEVTSGGGKSKTLVVALVAMAIGALIAGAGALYIVSEHKRQDEEQLRQQKEYEQMQKNKDPLLQQIAPTNSKSTVSIDMPIAPQTKAAVKPVKKAKPVQKRTRQPIGSLLDTIENAELRGTRHNDAHSALGD